MGERRYEVEYKCVNRQTTIMNYMDDVVEIGNNVYFYRQLPMGNPSLPSSFSRFANLGGWIERAVREWVDEVGRDEIRFSQSTLLLRPVGNYATRRSRC